MSKKKNLDLAPSRRERKTVGQYILLFFLIVYTLFCALPILLVFIAAFTDEKAITQKWFFIFPREMVNEWYECGTAIWKAVTYLLWSYHICNGSWNTCRTFLIMAMFAYAISRKGFNAWKIFYRFIY